MPFIQIYVTLTNVFQNGTVNICRKEYYEAIFQNHNIIVYPRLHSGEIDAQFVNLPQLRDKIQKIDAPIIELSSTFIRESIKNGKNVIPMLPNNVWEYVEHNLFYKK